MAEKKTNVVTWMNQGPEDIVYTPGETELRTLTQVVVPEHAVALFIRDGQLQGVLEPGRHMITSANIPWLTKLYNLALGYRENPFKVWIVYISLKMFNGKWGIRAMIKAAKGYEVPITLMANGDFQFRISDVNVFYTQVLGGMKMYTTGAVNDFMRSFISEQITQQMAQQYYMDVFSNLEGASSSTRILIDPYFQQRGIELLSLKIVSASTTEEEKNKVFEYLQFSSSNGEAFKRYEVMDRMADAIGNSEGGAAMGTGMLLFPQMYQQLQQQPLQGVQQAQAQAAQAQTAAAPAPAPAATAAPSGNTGFKICPYCGESLAGLKKTPKFCPFCSEQLN